MINPGDQFALSVQSISKLKYAARQSPETGLRKTAQQFEALFLQAMLDAMREAMPKSNLLHSNRTEMYQALLDRQWAQTLAARGIGLADMLVEQLDGASDKTIAGIPVAQPQMLPASQRLSDNTSKPATGAPPDLMLAERREQEPLVALSKQGAPLIGRQIATAINYTRQLESLPDHVSAFLQKMAPAAQRASRESGLPARLILAQAALETGWGRHELANANGNPSYNAFNIKATGWEGEAVGANTHEFADGQAYYTRSEFRVYDSYEHAFADYVRLLTQSPRYKPVINAPTPEAAARQLQACGYATDPHYADKLIAIMAQIPALQGPGVSPLFDRQPSGPLFADQRLA